MARGLCNVLPSLALALRSKPGNHGAKLGYFLLAFRVLVKAAHPDLADAVTVHPVCSWFLLAQLWQEQDQGV